MISTQDDPSSVNYWPRRVSVAHTDLSHALAQRGELDQAAMEGIIALSNSLLPLHGTAVKRVRELAKRLAKHQDVTEVHALLDRLEGVP